METTSKEGDLEVQETALNNTENASLNLGKGEFLTPRKDPAAEIPNLCTPDTFKSPMNFSSVTVEQLGITPESFVKSPAGKPSSFKKSRRRSTVGVRGSPETNHLIRFIAQQRNLKSAEKSPLAQNSPFQSSPGLYRNGTSLREQISAFQSAFYSIKEDEKRTEHPEFLETAKSNSVGMCKNAEISETSSKRRKLSSQTHSDDKCTGVLDLQKFSMAASSNTDRACAVENCPTDPFEKSAETNLPQSGCLLEAPVPLSGLTGTSNGIKVASCVQCKEASDPDSTEKLMDIMDVSTDPAPKVRSLMPPLCGKDNSNTIILRSVLKKPTVKQFAEGLQELSDNLCENEAHPNLISNLTKDCKERKADHFKEPTLLNTRKRKKVTFGEDLTPEVFDESLPANSPLCKGGTPVCKKNLGSISRLLLEQSPVPEHLPQPNFDDNEENLENIEPLQVALAVLSPLKSSVADTLSGTDNVSSSNNHENKSHKVGRVTRTSKRKIALKGCRKKRGRPKKAVEKSLYGQRDFASKKPLLSPILELPEFPEVMPSIPRFQMMESDDFNSNGEHEEMKLPERKNLLPENLEDLQKHQGFNYDVSESCSSYITSSAALDTTTFDPDLNINTIEVNKNESIPKAEITLESEEELKTGAVINNPVTCASLVEQHVDLGHPKLDLICQSQELNVASQNVENIFQDFKTSEGKYIKEEKQNDFLVTTDGKLQIKHVMPGTQKDLGCSHVLTDKIEENQSQKEDLGRSSAESSQGRSLRGRKQRRRSLCFSRGQNFPCEEDGDQQPCVVLHTSLEKPELCKELSDSIEQTFQQTKSKTRVRRSTRLQKDLENEGLVWVSPPFSLSHTSQKTRRRTISTFDSSGFENLLSRKETVSSEETPRVLPDIPGKGNSEGFVATNNLPSKRRRKSFCVSSFENTKNTTPSKSYKRRMLLNEKGGKFSNDLSEI